MPIEIYSQKKLCIREDWQLKKKAMRELIWRDKKLRRDQKEKGAKMGRFNTQNHNVHYDNIHLRLKLSGLLPKMVGSKLPNNRPQASQVHGHMLGTTPQRENLEAHKCLNLCSQNTKRDIKGGENTKNVRRRVVGIEIEQRVIA